MTYTINKKTTKKELKKNLEELPDKRKPVDFSEYFGKLKMPPKFNVEWKRRNRDDGTYNY